MPGRGGDPLLEPYRGFATPDALVVRGRVLTSLRRTAPEPENGRWTNLRADGVAVSDHRGRGRAGDGRPTYWCAARATPRATSGSRCRGRGAIPAGARSRSRSPGGPESRRGFPVLIPLAGGAPRRHQRHRRHADRNRRLQPRAEPLDDVHRKRADRDASSPTRWSWCGGCTTASIRCSTSRRARGTCITSSTGCSPAATWWPVRCSCATWALAARRAQGPQGRRHRRGSGREPRPAVRADRRHRAEGCLRLPRRGTAPSRPDPARHLAGIGAGAAPASLDAIAAIERCGVRCLHAPSFEDALRT